MGSCELLFAAIRLLLAAVSIVYFYLLYSLIRGPLVRTWTGSFFCEGRNSRRDSRYSIGRSVASIAGPPVPAAGVACALVWWELCLTYEVVEGSLLHQS